MKKLIIVLLIILGFISGCRKGDNERIVKLGVTSDEDVVWENVKNDLKEKGINLKIINFSDYIRPNLALEDKEIDMNAFQTEIYFDNFKKEHKLNIKKLGYTVLAPMAIYSSTIKNIGNLSNDAKVAIPNDVTNEGRALLLLQDAGLIKIDTRAGLFPTPKDIISNPKNLKFYELVATQIPRSLNDVDIAVINNGVAVEAGFSPIKDSLYIEDVKNKRLRSYFNIIAVRDDNINDPAIREVLKAYQSKKIKKIIIDYYKGASIPIF